MEKEMKEKLEEKCSTERKSGDFEKQWKELGK